MLVTDYVQRKCVTCGDFQYTQKQRNVHNTTLANSQHILKFEIEISVPTASFEIAFRSLEKSNRDDFVFQLDHNAETTLQRETK